MKLDAFFAKSCTSIFSLSSVYSISTPKYCKLAEHDLWPLTSKSDRNSPESWGLSILERASVHSSWIPTSDSSWPIESFSLFGEELSNPKAVETQTVNVIADFAAKSYCVSRMVWKYNKDTKRCCWALKGETTSACVGVRVLLRKCEMCVAW